MENQVENMMVDETAMDIKEENITPEELVIKEKQEWIRQFRLKFCVRDELDTAKNVIYADGSLNQE
jgi:hypothetical protein